MGMMHADPQFRQLYWFALNAIPLPGQQILANHPDHNIRAALASSPLTQVDIINTLITDKHATVRTPAFARTTNTDLLIDVIKRTEIGLGCAERAATNPLVPVDMLVKLLNDKHVNMALRAYCNPSTPQEAKQQLSPERAKELVESGSAGAGYIVRAHELVIANPWMITNVTQWGGSIRRAIAGMPEVTKETLDAVYKAGLAGRNDAASHPAYTGIDIYALTIAELLATNSVAGDTLALMKPELTWNDACEMLVRTANRHYLSPHIIGRLANKYGAPIFGAESYSIPKTKMHASNWIAPVMTYVWNMPTNMEQDAVAATQIIGNNVRTWQTFLALLPEWHGTLVALAKTATVI